jgi:hypothetical protein
VAVLVDPAVWPHRGELWSHLVSDVSYDELHAFAARLGVPRRAFQGDHYDIPGRLHPRALALGAEPVRARVLLARLTAAGLRDRAARPRRSAAPRPPSASVPPAS